MGTLDSYAGDFSRIEGRFAGEVKGKSAIITGSNTGLGFEIAKVLLTCGCNVIIATRNPENGAHAVKELSTPFNTYAPKAEVEFMHLDLSSLRSVKKFAEAFRAKRLPLDILVCNAAAWMPPDTMSPTEDGFEYQAASTYFGHVYLVELLKDKLKASAPSRLVWTTSAAESFGYIDWSDLAMTTRTSDFKCYGSCKLMSQMVCRVYAHQLQAHNVGVYGGQPGMSSTDFFNPAKFSWLRPGAVIQWAMQKFIGLTPAQGAWPIAYCTVAPAADLHSIADGQSYGPEYYSLGEWVGGAPQITNKGLIRLNEPQHPNVKEFQTCQRLYNATLAMLNSKEPVKEGPPLSAAVAADKAQDTVKSGLKSTFGMS